MSAFAAAAAALAADPHLGTAATYTPAGTGAVPQPLRIVLTREEAPALGPAGRGLLAGGYAAMIPVAALPDRPQKGDLLSVAQGGATLDFQIETAELDEAGASWRVQLRKA